MENNMAEVQRLDCIKMYPGILDICRTWFDVLTTNIPFYELSREVIYSIPDKIKSEKLK